ncbi:MAG: chromosome segregation protein SMC [Actinomycetota bacterium]|nr:chromosome segregation protein SMC [Actinomycetota bacterium]
MFLKRLSLKGFKSFADSVSLDLEPGVTVVVGPNGSGKSNVVDAVAWVLGAQAPSAVRSQRMDDVVFAGTASRPALGRAEVSLTIDNASGHLPIEFPEVTITRTLFRGGDSEYALNGAPCRLLDIQELLSDVGVGRQQHVIISQGQIDAVLNARLEDRRSIIEDAAGILKFRKRKEKAERRLDSTRSNLDRLGDLQREVRRQLRPLERQAGAARRHSDLVGELAALRLYRAGCELSELRTRSSKEADRRAELVADETRLEGEIRRLEDEISVAEAELADRGGDDLGDRLVRFEALRERGRGLRAVLVERLKGIDRDRTTLASVDLVVGLEAELARSQAEAEQLNEEFGSLAPEGDALDAAESVLATNWATFEADWAGGVLSLGGQAAETRGELGVLRAAAEQGAADRGRLADRLAVAELSFGALEERSDTLRAELLVSEEAEGPLSASVAALEARAQEAGRTRNAAWESVVAAEADLRGARTAVEALALALDEARSQAGVAHLAGIDGVLGTLLDLVEVDDGYEAAFEAAAADSLDAIVVNGVGQARVAIEALRRSDFSASVLAVGTAFPGEPASTVGEPMRPHVHTRLDGVNALLDRMLHGVVIVGGELRGVVDVALEHPDLVIVTHAGDRFASNGWRIGAGRRGATQAALEEAEARLVEAQSVHLQAQRVFEAAEHSNSKIDEELIICGRQLDEHDGRFAATTELLQRVQTQQRDLASDTDSLRSQLGGLDRRLDDELLRVAELENRLLELEAAEEASAEASRRMVADRNRLKERSTELAARRTGHEVRTADLSGRLAVVETRVHQVSGRLEQMDQERSEASDRRRSLDQRATATRRLIEEVDGRMAVADERLVALREYRRRQSERVRSVASRLDVLRGERSRVDELARGAHDRQSRLEVDRAETRMRLENLLADIRSEFDQEPDDVADTPCPQLPEGVAANDRILELERELKLMGPINALALTEFEALRERHEFLDEQLEDVRSTRKELRKVIRSIDEEIRSVFAAAFAEVSGHFEDLFTVLFPGGHGELRLTAPDDLLATGVEIEARPSGKNVKKLSLLSGGERSLTALAFLFAVFRSRPSPFYVMDEVEAALDDMNLHRFLGLVDQFRADAQLLIVSHQKRTMEAADCLYGVSMAAGGSSKVVSERIEAARVANELDLLAG